MHFLLIISTLALSTIVHHTGSADCPCGWLLDDQATVYAHHLYEDFSDYPIDVDSMLDNPLAAHFNEDWMIYDY
ncbi:hypothetical protein A1O7_04080 [Cladophialophora yegresii CBS 114405]|uniref:Uncharacterized protein n=1 Tax=Cladophialophora yegresii CBS 114405 TaxID=1182544 RepID=W9VVU8_9EURO|nr:uncharacterized protein A1O7_04080 [Cladophialophora yegresii CBS 114405]EXJ59932.1 hypothetical protein A1O7_04080 [Cladophialophora yegresii CBS 114405]